MNRTALVLLTLAALTIFGGIAVGRAVESAAQGMVQQRQVALQEGE